jgi:hypothetical protein
MTPISPLHPKPFAHRSYSSIHQQNRITDRLLPRDESVRSKIGKGGSCNSLAPSTSIIISMSNAIRIGQRIAVSRYFPFLLTFAAADPIFEFDSPSAVVSFKIKLHYFYFYPSTYSMAFGDRTIGSVSFGV